MSEETKPKNPRSPISVRPNPEQFEIIIEAKKRSLKETGISEKDAPFVLRMALGNIEKLWPDLKSTDK